MTQYLAEVAGCLEAARNGESLDRFERLVIHGAREQMKKDPYDVRLSLEWHRVFDSLTRAYDKLL